LLEREPTRPVLLVVGDVPLAPTFAPLVDEPAGAYALALFLVGEGEGSKLAFDLRAETAARQPARWPDAIEFLRWYLSGESRLILGSARRPWAWERLS
jgi:hypothetical protein